MSRHIRALDGLRGVAALAVVAYHAKPVFGIPGLAMHGYLAVDLFFVLSGFVLARAYEDRMAAPGGFRAFAAARIARLWPMMLIGALLGAGVAAATRAPDIALLTMLSVLCLPLLGAKDLSR